MESQLSKIYHLAQDVESVRFCELCYKLNMNRNRLISFASYNKQ